MYRTDCTVCNNVSCKLEHVETNAFKYFPVEASEFCSRTHCLDFAEIVLREIEPVLVHLGGDMLALLKHSLLDAEGRCLDTLERLDQVLADFQQKQHTLVGTENARVAAAAIAAAQKLLAEVASDNMWWFAKFFIQELAPFGQSDKDLVLKIMEDKLVVRNPDRLRKLYRRFSSQKPSTKSPQQHMQGSRSGSNGANSSNDRTNGKGSNSSQEKNRPDTRSSSDENNETKNFTAILERMKSFFTENQLFFFHFLHSCDSYDYARKDFTEVVLRLKVVAKFLGYLRFSPQWQVTSSLRQLSEHNAALYAIERERIDTLEVTRDSSLDVKKLLENSVLQASMSKCIPWLCDYLSMLLLDRLSSGTTSFKQLVALLQLLYRSPRLDYLGETGFYIAMQIERVFHVLHMGGCLLHSDSYQSQELLPSLQVRKALARGHEVSSKESNDGAGEDYIPFLHSQVFVQSCVSKLDDLRGFIQTRAQSLPRRNLSIGLRKMSSKQTVAPIRKLRPLQVGIENDSCVDAISLSAVKPDAAHATPPGMVAATALLSRCWPLQDENDKLSDAVFMVHPKLESVVDLW
ncbi:unnamed protein product [Peronospora belbahrii]|uniref:Uncharacterized protein n=1 Tax=Peronospora belbahrii TaxID=622444 RepID=A0ABN8CMK2_9STRA|nr:unnamed protein product [Peronospora belbahrii]